MALAASGSSPSSGMFGSPGSRLHSASVSPVKVRVTPHGMT
jgi:hypothetical protein